MLKHGLFLLLFYNTLLIAEICPGTTTSRFSQESKTLENIIANADNFSAQENKIHLLGSVDISKGQQLFKSEQVYYLPEEEAFNFPETFTLEDNDLIIYSEQGIFYSKTETGVFETIKLDLKQQAGHAKANNITLKPNEIFLQQGTYTTCPEKTPSWEIGAKQLRIDKEKGILHAKNLRLNFKGGTVFYWPYWSFPIDNRRLSGFLLPILSSSETTGVSLAIPYYLNLAPNYDATITPVILSKKGLKLNTEFRYLTDNAKGIMETSYLYDTEIEKNRYLLKLDHKQLLTSKWHLEIQASEVSDNNYFKDLSNDFAVSNIEHIPRSINVYYQDEYIQFKGIVQNFQHLTNTDTPYQRLPGLYLKTYPYTLASNFNLSFDSSWVNFVHKDNLTEGNRAYAAIQMDYLFYTKGLMIKPMAKLRHRYYQLNQQDNISKTLPTLSLDISMPFSTSLKNDYEYVFKPKIFYLYTPHQAQDNIPIFDTEQATQGFYQLFRDNRYSSIDRIGDANQLTLALSNHWYQSGESRFYTHIGQIFYLESPKVVLPNETRQELTRSDAILEAGLHINHWQIQNITVWNEQENVVDKVFIRTQYEKDNKRLRFAYRYTQDKEEQIDMGFSWPLNDTWSVFSYWNYSLEDQQTLELQTGFAYDSCCWSLRFGAKRYALDDNRDDYNTAFALQLELKGLTYIGYRSKDLYPEEIFDDF